MKIAVVSDTHLEFEGRIIGNIDADVLILAGDIGSKFLGVEFALKLAKKHPNLIILYVPGNHEFYGIRNVLKHIAAMKAEVEGTNVHVMYNDIFELDNYRFIGTTLWTDFDLFGTAPLSMIDAVRNLNDYTEIGWVEGEPLNPEDILEEFKKAKYFIFNNVSEDKTNVVITHHAPSVEGVDKVYRFDKATPCYASRLENDIAYSNIKYWIQGHTHVADLDYMIGECRVIGRMTGYYNKKIKFKHLEI